MLHYYLNGYIRFKSESNYIDPDRASPLKIVANEKVHTMHFFNLSLVLNSFHGVRLKYLRSTREHNTTHINNYSAQGDRSSFNGKIIQSR